MASDGNNLTQRISCDIVCWIVGIAAGVFAWAVARVWAETGLALAFVGGVVAVLVVWFVLSRVFCGSAEADAPVAEAESAPQKAQHSSQVTATQSQGQSRPQGLDAARNNMPDDLRMIKGIGPGLQISLNKLGIFHFDQIAAWSADEVDWIDNNMAKFKGRATRDSWVKQAAKLADGGETEFSGRVKKGDVY